MHAVKAPEFFEIPEDRFEMVKLNGAVGVSRGLAKDLPEIEVLPQDANKICELFGANSRRTYKRVE
jgi:hypothetical protein